LVEYGIEEELGWEVVEIKRPTFHYSDAFDLTYFGQKFDFILAQSIFTHAAPHMIHKCLSEAVQVMHPDSAFIATYFQGDTNYQGETWAQQPDARYTEPWFKNMCSSHGLTHQRLEYGHPSGQSWFKMRRK